MTQPDENRQVYPYLKSGSRHRGTPTEGESSMWESKYEAQNKYDMLNTTQVKLKLNDKTDADILKWIRQKKRDCNSTIQGSIKELIRKQIALETSEITETKLES